MINLPENPPFVTIISGSSQTSASSSIQLVFSSFFFFKQSKFFVSYILFTKECKKPEQPSEAVFQPWRQTWTSSTFPTINLLCSPFLSVSWRPGWSHLYLSSVYCCCSCPEATAAGMPRCFSRCSGLFEVLYCHNQPAIDAISIPTDHTQPPMCYPSFLSSLKMEILYPRLKLKHGERWKSDWNGDAMMRMLSVFILIGQILITLFQPHLPPLSYSREAALRPHFTISITNSSVAFIILFLCCLPAFRATDCFHGYTYDNSACAPLFHPIRPMLTFMNKWMGGLIDE